jgi:membrane protein
MLANFLKHISAWIWSRNLDGAKRGERMLFHGLRLFYAVLNDIAQGQITMRAMGLVYTSLLSLIPLLALGFSLLKAFGVRNVIQPMLSRFLKPLGPNAHHLTHQLISFVQNMNMGVLGFLGLVLLIFMVLSMVSKIESDLNFVWQVKQARNLRRRIGDYVTVLLAGPVLLFAATALTALANNNATSHIFLIAHPLGTLVYFFGKILPYLLIGSAFTFLYIFVPNTRVRFLPALAGGLFAGLVWQSASLLFASFVAGSGRYNAIYSGFAIIVLLLIWLYVSWLILLIGGRIAFYLQHPESLRQHAGAPRLGARLELELALTIMLLVGRGFWRDDEPWSAESLAQRIQVPVEALNIVLGLLLSRRLLVLAGEKGNCLLPGRDLDTLSVRELIRLVAMGERGFHSHHDSTPPFELVRDMLSSLDSALEKALGDVSLKDLVRELENQDKVKVMSQPNFN